MAKRLSLLQLQFGVISLNLLQILSADLRSVDPGQNITLLCNLTASSQISWFHMNSSGVRKIIITRRGNLNKSFYVRHNEDESQFALAESRSSASLEIIGVRETELGFYYCGGQNNTDHMKFGKPIRLNFTDHHNHQLENTSVLPDLHQSPGAELLWIIIPILMCVCSGSVLINAVCMCVCCSRNPDKCVSSESDEMDVDLRHSDELTCVTYTRVS